MQQEQANRLREAARRHEQKLKDAAESVQIEKRGLAEALRREEEEEEEERVRLAEQRRIEEQKEKERSEAVQVEQQKRGEQQRQLEQRLARLRIDEANEKRQREIATQCAVVDSSMELLRSGVASGRIKADVFYIRAGHIR